MSKKFALSAALVLASCGPGEPDKSGAEPTATPTEAPAANLPVAPSAAPAEVPSEAPSVTPQVASARTLNCEFNNEVKFQISLTGMVESTNPRGGSETHGKYRTKGDAIGLVPERGDAAIRGGVYVLNDELFLEPTDNGKFIVSQGDSGDIVSCAL